VWRRVWQLLRAVLWHWMWLVLRAVPKPFVLLEALWFLQLPWPCFERCVLLQSVRWLQW
jgi:hypothetical protein